MAIASPVRTGHRPAALTVAPTRLVPPVPAEGVRDELTRDRLVRSVEHLPGLQVLGFHSDWWDGQTHVPCLVIRGGRRSRRLRVVETTGECVVVPFARRVAERWLAARRRPGRVELGIPAQRRPVDVVIDATGDTVRCSAPACGALLPVGYDGTCPLCG